MNIIMKIVSYILLIIILFAFITFIFNSCKTILEDQEIVISNNNK